VDYDNHQRTKHSAIRYQEMAQIVTYLKNQASKGTPQTVRR